MWFWLILYGLVITAFIWSIQRKWDLKIRGIAVIGTTLGIIAVFFLEQAIETSFLSGSSWYNKSPYSIIIFATLMLLGMAVRFFSKAIEDRRDKIVILKRECKEEGISEEEVRQKIKSTGLEFDKYEFAYPFLFSVITFGLLLKQIDVKEITTSSVIMSFQTGFFWQTILKKEMQ